MVTAPETTPVVEDQPKKSDQKQLEVQIVENGALDFHNQSQLVASARLLIRMKMAPEHLTKVGLEAVMSAMVFCRQHSLPSTAMNDLAFIKGKLTAYGSLVTALAERHPEYGDKEEFFITKEGEKICSENKNLATGVAWAHVMRIRKKESQVFNEYYFSIDDALQAGLLTEKTNSDSGWIKYTKDLLYHKNKNRALKANYASAIAGIQYHEELQYDVREAKPSLADEMNEAYLEKDID